MRKIILVFSLILWTPTIYAQYNMKTSEELTADFFRMYKRDTDAAFDFLFETNESIVDDKNIIENVKLRIREYKKNMGDFVGFEKLINKSLGESLKVSVYLVKYEKQPLRFIFKYYKSKDKWILYKFNFDGNIDENLDEIIKYGLLNKSN